MLEAQAYGPRSIILLARRNCSIAPMTLCGLTAAAALLSLAIALFWAWQGAWLILPFAGVEVVGLVVALLWYARHVGDFERIDLHEDSLVVEVCETDRVSRYEFDPRLTQLVASGGRLGLRDRDRELPIGRYLGEEERLELEAELSRWIVRARR